MFSLIRKGKHDWLTHIKILYIFLYDLLYFYVFHFNIFVLTPVVVTF